MNLIDNIFEDTNEDFAEFIGNDESIYDNYDDFDLTNEDFAEFLGNEDEDMQWYDAIDESKKYQIFDRVLESIKER